MINFRKQSGLTVIELLIAIAVSSILVLALTMLVGRTFQISREQVAQSQNTEDARLQIERLATTIRNAVYVDCDSSGDDNYGYTDGENDKFWIKTAEPYKIEYYANIKTDGDDLAELVSIYIEEGDTKLIRTVIGQDSSNKCQFNQTEEQVTLITSVQNRTQANAKPIFEYYGKDNDLVGSSVSGDDLKEINGVKISLIIDADVDHVPDAIELSTQVSCRTSVCTTGDCGEVNCYDPGAKTINEQYTFNSNNFADEAFAKCNSSEYCDTDSGTCCGWSVDFYWDGEPDGDVQAYCKCKASKIPEIDSNDIGATNVSVGEYTSYVKECLDGTSCHGVNGTPYCEPGCLTQPGQCACKCPN